ncbi:MAG: hypothetical protein QMC83_10385, partial [Thermodesulfovibrionales bacterium]|nr:hypothetical protein [Thermodesulfovibrionales bacterium]
IVLVIIGIILGAVLKGQELINNAKVKRAYNQQREILAAFYTYYDKYGKFPGDDNTVTARWTASVNGDNDGLIDGGFVYNCTGGEIGGEESCNVWRHLRLANIIIGSGRINPQHPYGGAISVAYGTVWGVAANWIAFQNIPTDVALILDSQYDDGVYSTGSIQGSANYGTVAPIVLYSRL